MFCFFTNYCLFLSDASRTRPRNLLAIAFERRAYIKRDQTKFPRLVSEKPFSITKKLNNYKYQYILLFETAEMHQKHAIQIFFVGLCQETI